MTVKQKQHLLGYLGFYTGAVDGIWGTASREASVRFQEKYDLPRDEFFGEESQRRILEVIGNGEEPEKTDFWQEIEYFDRAEFKCTCGGRGCSGFPAEPVEQLVRNADAARKHFGKVARVSSGVRCKLRNSELPGSAANSLHMRGKAIDFCVTGVSANRLLKYIQTLPKVHEAYAIDGNYVHMGVEKY